MSTQEKPTGEQQGAPISLPQYLGHSLALLAYTELPFNAEELWYVTDADTDQGQKMNFATVTMMGPNIVFTNWFDEENLESHIQRATNALMRLRAKNAASGKLVTASGADLQKLNEMTRNSGIVLPGE